MLKFKKKIVIVNRKQKIGSGAKQILGILVVPRTNIFLYTRQLKRAYVSVNTTDLSKVFDYDFVTLYGPSMYIFSMALSLQAGIRDKNY